jgi:hypothetical protein
VDTKGSIKAVLSTLLAEGKDRPVIINIGDDNSEVEVESTNDAASLAKELKSGNLTKTKKVEKEKDTSTKDAAVLSKALKADKPSKPKKPNIYPEPMEGGIRETLKVKNKKKNGWEPLSESLR